MNTIGYRNPRFYQARTMPRLDSPIACPPPRRQTNRERANQPNKTRRLIRQKHRTAKPSRPKASKRARPASRPKTLCPLSRARAALPRMLSSPVSQSSESESIRPGGFWPALLTGACFSSGTSRARAPTRKCASLARNNPRQQSRLVCAISPHPSQARRRSPRPITQQETMNERVM